MQAEIVCDAAVEGLETEEVCHHANDGGTLAVGDAVEDLVDLVRVIDRNRDRVRRLQRICCDLKNFMDELYC